MIAADTAKAARLALSGLIPQSYQRPADWAQANIKFTHAKDPIKGPLDLSLTPYLIDPINAWELIPGQGLKEVTVVAPEQTGKSLSWMCGELWSLRHSPGLSLIYYTSDQKAARVNEEKLEPMMRNIPRLSELLDMPLAKNAKCYRLNESLIYFSGVGARVSSHSARRSVADETDDWDEKKGVNSINDLRNRARAFPESLVFKVCTPKGTDSQSRIWKEFKASSQGYWYLRCQGCQILTIRSCDIVRMQYERTEAGDVVEESIRVICPKCGREHVEEEKYAMNRQGAFIHRHPERLESHPGFQWGALASTLVTLRWPIIAEAQNRAGKSGDLDKQKYFDNSIRGRPFKVRALDDTGKAAIKRHSAPLPEPAAIRYRFLSVDTQDNCFYWIVRGIDARDNTYYLDSGQAVSTDDLAEVWERQFYGGPLVCGIIDEGGHRAGEVREFAAARPGFFTYKGNPHIGKNFKKSEEVKNLILANPNHYRLSLLFRIYASVNRGNHYWFVPEKLPEDYQTQITSWKPNPQVKDGHLLENYCCADGNDHYFDCEKMFLVLLDYFLSEIAPLLLAARRRKTVNRS